MNSILLIDGSLELCWNNIKKNGYLIVITLLCCLLFLLPDTANASRSEKQPKWVRSESVQYPSHLYITGVGFATDRQAAEDAALTSISRIFSAQVNSSSYDHEEYTSSNTKTTQQLTINQSTSIATRKLLSNVAIKEVWVDKGSNQVYALAVLDRQHAAASLKEKILGLDASIALLVKRADKPGADRLIVAGSLYNAIRMLVARADYNADYRIINPYGSGVYSTFVVENIKDRLKTVLSASVLVGIKISGAANREVKQAVQEGFTERGFSITDDLSKSDIQVKGNLDLVKIDGASFKSIKWRVGFDIYNTRSGLVIGTLKLNGRSSHINFAAAERKAVRLVQGGVSSTLVPQMISLIFKEP